MVLEDRSIVCFASDGWDTIWRNRHQIMSRLARTNRVLYVEPHVYPVNQSLKAVIRFQPQGERLRHIADGLWAYRHPLWGFMSRWPVADQIGRQLRVLALRRILGKLHMASPILWVVDPLTSDMVKQFKGAPICYHAVDNYAAAPWRSPEKQAKVKESEAFMLSVADLVIVTSPALLAEKRQYNDNVHLVKNAVDYDRFVETIEGSNGPPADMAAISAPIMGYVGAVNNKLDFELINTVVRAKPDWSFVFVGPISDQLDATIQEFVQNHPPNVHLLGQRDVAEVPRYIQACQVCLLPYRLDEYTKNIDSLKLYEYLACEKPIVATDIPATRAQSQVVHIANDATDFTNKLEQALAPLSSQQCALKKSIALQNTWDQRVEQISSLLRNIM
jgi:glycosyltransferase involved in cell wall biosynthesis